MVKKACDKDQKVCGLKKTYLVGLYVIHI